MKLVDILARELKVWPDRAIYAWQDWNLEIRFRHSMESDFFVDRKSCDHVRQRYEGNPTQGVTRAQWQAAVDALKVGEQVWDGEGLPPVGTVCITEHESENLNVKVLAYGKHHQGRDCIMVADMRHGYEGKMFAWLLEHCEFRPIRTAEQIAAEELREIIESGLDGMKTINQVIDEIIDAGYRKQVQP